MEIKAELIKPYTDKQKTRFIVENNHKLGYVIKETETSLQALGLTEQEKENIKQERIAMLSLTAADVERGIYKAKGMDFDDVIEYAKQFGVNVKELKIELKANNFYRGNIYVDKVGELLGFSKKQLDDFFTTGDYTKLLALEV